MFGTRISTRRCLKRSWPRPLPHHIQNTSFLIFKFRSTSHLPVGHGTRNVKHTLKKRAALRDWTLCAHTHSDTAVPLCSPCGAYMLRNRQSSLWLPMYGVMRLRKFCRTADSRLLELATSRSGGRCGHTGFRYSARSGLQWLRSNDPSAALGHHVGDSPGGMNRSWDAAYGTPRYISTRSSRCSPSPTVVTNPLSGPCRSSHTVSVYPSTSARAPTATTTAVAAAVTSTRASAAVPPTPPPPMTAAASNPMAAVKPPLYRSDGPLIRVCWVREKEELCGRSDTGIYVVRAMRSVLHVSSLQRRPLQLV